MSYSALAEGMRKSAQERSLMNGYMAGNLPARAVKEGAHKSLHALVHHGGDTRKDSCCDASHSAWTGEGGTVYKNGGHGHFGGLDMLASVLADDDLPTLGGGGYFGGYNRPTLGAGSYLGGYNRPQVALVSMSSSDCCDSHDRRMGHFSGTAKNNPRICCIMHRLGMGSTSGCIRKDYAIPEWAKPELRQAIQTGNAYVSDDIKRRLGLLPEQAMMTTTIQTTLPSGSKIPPEIEAAHKTLAAYLSGEGYHKM